MTDWWNGLTLLEKVFYYCAVPATLVLAVQTILSIFGIGHGDADVDFSVDSDTYVDSHIDMIGNHIGDTISIDSVESASSLKFFSVRGIVAFFSLFGWVGVILSGKGINTFLVFFVSTLCGLLGMLFIAVMFYMISKMQRSGNINIKNAVGRTGQVYLTIPAKQSGTGKIQINIQDRYSEVSAMTNSVKPLATGTMVRVVGVVDINTLLVEKQD